jgi:hypothetical protein
MTSAGSLSDDGDIHVDFCSRKAWNSNFFCMKIGFVLHFHGNIAPVAVLGKNVPGLHPLYGFKILICNENIQSQGISHKISTILIDCGPER